MRIFNIINKSTNISEADLNLMVEACRVQLNQHAAPLLERMPWEIKVGGNDGFPVVLIDSPDVAGALGYHTQDPDGRVWCRVFTDPLLKNGGTTLRGAHSVSVVLSHEILETFYNPYVNLWSNRGDHTFVALELCDPVQGDCYDVDAKGAPVSVSNFVLEAWFDREMHKAGRFDYMNKLTKPLDMTSGGYTVIFNSETGEVKSVFASKEGEDLHSLLKPGHPASRSARNKNDCPMKKSCSLPTY
jgi:hypothetical protein